MDTRVSLKQAIKSLGFQGGNKHDTELNQWMNHEKEVLLWIPQFVLSVLRFLQLDTLSPALISVLPFSVLFLEVIDIQSRYSDFKRR